MGLQLEAVDRTLVGREIDQLVAHATEAVDRRRDDLEAQFGWTHLRASVHARPLARLLAVDGAVVLHRLIDELGQDLLQVIPPGWALLNNLRALTGPWRSLAPGVTPLERHVPSPGDPVALSTELVREDGPVEVLAQHGAASLVRAVDGTIGWTTSRLGPVVQRPGEKQPQLRVSRLERVLRSYVGVPYRLGGTTRSGIDCSGLVQRTFRSALDTVVPRHSLDQLRASAPPARPLGEIGDLIYVWSRAESPCHVGVVVRGDRGVRRRIVHASASRRCVTEEPLDAFLARADRVCHVEIAQVLDRRHCHPST